ncbi:hypothetical protein [Nostoc sp.]
MQITCVLANPGDKVKARDRCFIAASREFEESWQDANSNYSEFFAQHFSE